MENLFQILCVSFVMSAVGLADQPRLTDEKKSITDVLVFHSKNGYSFKYHSCWRVAGELDNVTESDHVTVGFTKECPKNEQGTWMIEVDRIGSTVTNEDWVNTYGKDGSHRIVYKKTFDVSGNHAILYETLKDESEKLIDRLDQNNFIWSLKLYCDKSNLEFYYIDHLDKKGRDDARNNHEPPKVFKEFIDGFNCDLKK